VRFTSGFCSWGAVSGSELAAKSPAGFWSALPPPSRCAEPGLGLELRRPPLIHVPAICSCRLGGGLGGGRRDLRQLQGWIARPEPRWCDWVWISFGVDGTDTRARCPDRRCGGALQFLKVTLYSRPLGVQCPRRTYDTVSPEVAVLRGCLARWISHRVLIQADALLQNRFSAVTEQRGRFLLTVKAKTKDPASPDRRAVPSTPCKILSRAIGVWNAAMDATHLDTQRQNRLPDFINERMARPVS